MGKGEQWNGAPERKEEKRDVRKGGLVFLFLYPFFYSLFFYPNLDASNQLQLINFIIFYFKLYFLVSSNFLSLFSSVFRLLFRIFSPFLLYRHVVNFYILIKMRSTKFPNRVFGVISFFSPLHKPALHKKDAEERKAK